MAIQIAQRIKAPDYIELQPSTQPMSNNYHKQPNDSSISPMDIDVQNVQFTKKNSLLDRDSHGKRVVFTVMGMAMLKNIAGNWRHLNIIRILKSNWLI